jgi:hypothetical protein
VWGIIANAEAIAVNQAWAGHPGKLLKSLPSGQKDNAQKNGCGGYSCDTQVWTKPLSLENGSVAVVLLSNSDPWKSGTKVANTSYMIDFSWLGESSIWTSFDNHARDLFVHHRVGWVSDFVCELFSVTGMTGTKGVAVHDVWRPSEDVGGAHLKGFETDAFGGHDSRFYIFTPFDVRGHATPTGPS